jgi:hypothetical protein
MQRTNVLSIKPSIENRSPRLNSRIDAAVPEQEGMELLAGNLALCRSCAARTDQIAHGLMCGIGHPNRREFTRAQQFGEHDGIAPVSLHAIAGCSRNEAGSNHVTEVSGFHDLPIDAVTAAARFVAQMQRGIILAKFLEQLRKCSRSVVNRAAAQNLAVAAFVRYGNGDFLLVNVKTDETCVWHIFLLRWEYSVG